MTITNFVTVYNWFQLLLSCDC